jgi:hypothetical protein
MIIDPNEIDGYERWSSGITWGVCVTGLVLVTIGFGFLVIKNVLMALGF